MTKRALTQIIERLHHEEHKIRDYIGASSIGSDCLRQIWYEFKHDEATVVPNQLQRTWDIGKILEDFVIGLLVSAGIPIIRPHADNNYLEFQESKMPFFKGHCDALILEPKRILEVKTAKDSSFILFVKHGLKKWNLRYYAQLQSYMGMSGIHEAYIIVLNKDNSEIMDELVYFDANFYGNLKLKAQVIHEAKSAPPRINGSPLWFQCKLCKFNKVCHV